MGKKKQESTEPEILEQDSFEKKEAQGEEASAAEEQAEVVSEKEAALAAELEKEKAKSADYLNTAQRLQAEFDNFRRRNQTLRADAYQDGKLETLKEILPVLDNFERAMAAGDEADAFFGGVAQIQRQLIDVLTKMGLEEIPALGEPFDPQVHNAVMQGPADETYAPGTVCEVLQKGYRVGDKVLRYTMVKVAAE